MSVYKCPICGGRGFVPCGFYSSQTYDGSSITNSTSTEVCRSCHGRGIVFDEFLGSTSNGINRCCSNCEMNDGLVYTSYPPKYRCTLSGNFKISIKCWYHSEFKTTPHQTAPNPNPWIASNIFWVAAEQSSINNSCKPCTHLSPQQLYKQEHSLSF